MDTERDKSTPKAQEQRLVIGLDYGTTFTGVAYATPRGDECSLEDIVVLSDWGPQMMNAPKVPSVISYSPPTQAEAQQWGSSLSPNAVTMVHTKLELDVGKVEDELDELGLIISSLEGTRNLGAQLHSYADRETPEYDHYSTEEIISEYLTHVLKCLGEAVDRLSPKLRYGIPTDIVVTVPSQWTYEAMNSTYRALTKAGFNHTYFPCLREVIFVTESEAAAISTAKYLMKYGESELLKINEPFILCDTGGGIVEVASYKVTQLQPMLRIERVSMPTSRKCGSVFINLAFKRWLRTLIGDKNYQQLDPEMEATKISSHTTEGKAMRQLMNRFDNGKVMFHSDYGHDIYLDLPAPLYDLDIPGRVDQGQIIIKSKEMEQLFDQCVNDIVGLIAGHMTAIWSTGGETRLHLKNVFLVGGFGESQYLQDELAKYLRLHHITLRRPDTSWTAVVQGAVICGIEKTDSDNLVRADYCRHHYGIVPSELLPAVQHSKQDMRKDRKSGLVFPEDHLLWFLSKGDLLLSTRPLSTTKVISLGFGPNETRKKVIHFYGYSKDGKRPTRFHNARHELFEVFNLDLNLTGPEFKNEFQILRRNPDVIGLEVEVTMTVVGDIVSASVWRGRKELGAVSSSQVEKQNLEHIPNIAVSRWNVAAQRGKESVDSLKEMPPTSALRTEQKTPSPTIENIPTIGANHVPRQPFVDTQPKDLPATIENVSAIGVNHISRQLIVDAHPKDLPDWIESVDEAIKSADSHSRARVAGEFEGKTKLAHEDVDALPEDIPHQPVLLDADVKLGDSHSRARAVGRLEDTTQISREALDESSTDPPVSPASLDGENVIITHIIWPYLHKLSALLGKAFQKSPRHGSHRITWTCGCGQAMFADVKEVRSGAALALQTKLRQAAVATVRRPQYGSPNISRPPQAYTLQSYSDSPNFPGLRISSTTPNTRDGTGAASVELTSIVSGPTNNVPPVARPLRYVLLCVNTRRSRSLENIDITAINTDEALFGLIRERYNLARKSHKWHLPLLKWIAPLWKDVLGYHVDLSISKPNSADYVRFHLVPVKMKVCPSNLKLHNLPPENEVKKLKNYDYCPCPPDIEEPLLQNQFMHELFEPGPHLDGFWMESFPKKLRGPLNYVSGRRPIGWGIIINEGINWAVLWFGVLFVLMLTGIGVFVCALRTGDLSSAMGLGAYFVAVVTLVVTLHYYKWQEQ